jgi:hypothetical protein
LEISNHHNGQSHNWTSGLHPYPDFFFLFAEYSRQVQELLLNTGDETSFVEVVAEKGDDGKISSG